MSDLETARKLGETEAYLELARAENERLRARVDMATESATLLKQVYAQLDEEYHPMAGLVYQAEMLAIGIRRTEEDAA